MKVLYIGHYFELSGWGVAGRNYIRAMDSVGIDLCCRAIKFDKSKPTDPLILELENKDIKNCDIVIQNILCHLMEYDGNFKKNIGMFSSETLSIKPTSWPANLNLMDECWVINNMSKKVTEECVDVPVKVVPHATDITKFEETYPEPKFDQEIQDTFKFYFIGEAIQRKNLHTLLKAFHIEFGLDEPVSLVIKSSYPGLNGQQCQEHITNIINQIKTGLRLYPSINHYHKEILITDRWSEKDLYGLHQACDCFVMPSCGEAWCIPAFDSLGFGNPVIATNTGGMADYIKSSVNGWLIPTREEPVFAMNHTAFVDLNTARETWHNPSVLDLMKCMRLVFEQSKEDKEKMSDRCKDSVQKYSYENIGNHIKDLLSE